MLNRLGNVCLRSSHCLLQAQSLRQICRQAARKRAASAMRIFRSNTLAGKPRFLLTVKQQIVCRIAQVPALDQHGLRTQSDNFFCYRTHLTLFHNLHARNSLSLRQIRRQQRRQGQQLTNQRSAGLRRQQRITALRNHHRVHDDNLRLIFAQAGRNRFNNLRLRNHTDFHSIYADIIKNCFNLRLDDIAVYILHLRYATGVLRSNSSNYAHAKSAMSRKGLEVGLNSGAAAGITAGNS